MLSRADIVRRHRSKKRQLGICVNCAKPAMPGKTLCAMHMGAQGQRSAKRMAKLAAAGVCRNCGKPKTDDTLCMNCRIKTTVQLRLKRSVKSGIWLILKEKLERQDFRCAYTGMPITPGINASIDHIVPSSRGGTDEPENLQWVSALVNRMKTDMTHDEFLAMCRQIIQRSG